MPVAATATMSARIQAGAPRATVTASLQPVVIAEEGVFEPGVLAPDLRVATVTADVLRDVEGALAGATTVHHARVKLAGDWVPVGELVGPVRIRESRDTWAASAEFGVAGERWSVFRTLSTWTKTPVEIWTAHGAPGEDLEAKLELRFHGVVQPPAEQTSIESGVAGEPVLRIRCSSDASLFDGATVCVEVPPGAGLRRGEIATAFAADVGQESDVPDGGELRLPVQATGARLFPLLQQIGEVEDWFWRFRPDGVCEAYSAAVPPAPLPTDDTWTLGDVFELSVTTPSDPPSRYVVRGHRMVFEDESALTTEVTRTVIEDVYAPRAATQRQASDGTITERNVTEVPALRVVAEIRDVVQRRGDRVESQTTIERGWKNPLAARLRTPIGTEGDGPENGYWFVPASIDSEGRFVVYTRERFLEVARRTAVHTHHPDGTLAQTLERFWRWDTRDKAVQVVNGDGTRSWLQGVRVSGDGRSLVHLAGSNQVETYDEHERRTTKLTHDPVSGAGRSEELEVRTAYALQAVLAEDNYVLADGSGRAEPEAVMRRTSRILKENVLRSDGSLVAETEREEGWFAPQVLGGAFDYGHFSSDRPVEIFTVIGRSSRYFRQLTEDTYEVVELDPETQRSPTVLSGRVPVPRFRASVWTRMVQQPLEAVLQDDVLEELFGRRSEVVDNPFVGSLADAQRVAERRRRFATARQVTVSRPLTPRRVGHSLTVLSAPDGLAHRGLIAEVETVLDLELGSATGNYVVEMPL